MSMSRLLKHLCSGSWLVRDYFPAPMRATIQKAIAASELRHSGEIRFAIEASLPTSNILRGQTARDRAIGVFSELRVWDTADNNGVLLYILIADHQIEIVADRGINAVIPQAEWEDLCHKIEAHFKDSRFEEGVLLGIEEITKKLEKHFPRGTQDKNELPDEPVVL